jgi:hypothetical protein
MLKRIAWMSLAAAMAAAAPLAAQGQGLFDMFSDPAADIIVGKEIALTDDIVKRYAGAAKETRAKADSFGQFFQAGKVPNQAQLLRYTAQRESVALNHGFKLDSDYQNAQVTIEPIVASIDVQSGVYIDSQTRMQKDIARLEADTNLSAEEKADVIAGLKESLAMTKPHNPENVKVVVKYAKDLRGF